MSGVKCQAPRCPYRAGWELVVIRRGEVLGSVASACGQHLARALAGAADAVDKLRAEGEEVALCVERNR